jgi:hypothetical protein
MDRRLRRLQRLAAAGDLRAQSEWAQLIQQLAASGVPEAEAEWTRYKRRRGIMEPMVPPALDEFELDAYGHLTYSIGYSYESDDAPEDDDRGDWIACADFDVLGDWIAYHVVVDSDSGGFIDTMEAGVLDPHQAARQLPSLLDGWTDTASEHLAAGGDWFTEAEQEANEKSSARWRKDVRETLAVLGVEA